MLRNYADASAAVRQCYEHQRRRHDVSHVLHLVNKYDVNYGRATTVPEVLAALDDLVDVSDPDLDLPNSQHALQAAEAACKAGEPDWMVVCALIHDFGKMICFLAPCDDDGTSAATQWSVVGDTFLCGQPPPPSLPFPSLPMSPALVPYPPGCGLRNTTIAFGHDEFLFRALRRMVAGGQCALPLKALDAIRFHSLYAWHTHGAYTEFEDEHDRATKPLVRRLNKYDLYSKDNGHRLTYTPELEQRVRRFFPGGLLRW